MSRRLSIRAASLFLAAALALLAACGDAEPERPRPVLVIGIDGADWDVIEALWAEGRLPHLKALSERGVRKTLRTAYSSISAVVWSSIATGVTPERHGITDFVIATDEGAVPVSSTVRKVPALWNMASTAERRSAVLGWWATWPAEDIRGVVISDRIQRNLERTFSPPDFADELAALEARAAAEPLDFPPNIRAERDRLVTVAAADLLARREYDLVLAYYKSVDNVGHHYWKYFRPRNFAPIPEDELAAHAEVVPRAYEAADRAVGRLLEAAGADTNVFVLSDHGFYALKEERLRVSLDLDKLLAELGFLVYDGAAVDFSRTQVYTHATPPHRLDKDVRFALAGREPGGRVSPGERAAIRARLRKRLAAIRYAGGEPVFRVRDARANRPDGGGDFVVRVLSEGATDTLLDGGRPILGVLEIDRISGSHGGSTHGIFLAAGPDIDPQAELGRITILDMAPTLLRAMGLPTAEDFDGRPLERLFTTEFRDRFPPVEIASWGTAAGGDALASEVDEELVRELRALGYLD